MNDDDVGSDDDAELASILSRFGLPAQAAARDEIIARIEELISIEERHGSRTVPLRLYCVMLFSIGSVEDSLLIWKAKSCSFDAGCSIDVEFLCGAGLLPTIEYLERCPVAYAARARDYVAERLGSDDFDVDETLANEVAFYCDAP